MFIFSLLTLDFGLGFFYAPELGVYDRRKTREGALTLGNVPDVPDVPHVPL